MKNIINIIFVFISLFISLTLTNGDLNKHSVLFSPKPAFENTVVSNIKVIQETSIVLSNNFSQYQINNKRYNFLGLNLFGKPNIHNNLTLYINNFTPQYNSDKYLNQYLRNEINTRAP